MKICHGGGAVVGDPAHPAGRRKEQVISLVNEPVERLGAGGLLAAAEHRHAVLVPGGS
jgi:hypothetical protein